MTNKLYPAVIQHIVKGAISNSGFLPNVNPNRLNALVENGVTNLIDQLGITEFKPNTTLDTICKHLEPAFKEADNPGATLIDKLIKSNHSFFATNSSEELIKAFGISFSSTKQEIDHCHSEVNTLLQQFDSEFKKMAKEAPIPDYKNTPVNVESWELNSSLGPEHILVTDINKSTGFDTGEPNLSAFRVHANKIYVARKGEAEKLIEAKFSKEQKEAIASKIAKWGGITEPEATFIFNSVCSPQGVNYFYNEIMAIQTGPTYKAFEVTKKNLKLIISFIKGYNKLMEDQTDVNTYIDNTTVKTNVQHLVELQRLGIYALTYFRHNVWDNLLILPNKMVNSDLQAEATAQGITKEDLRLAIYSNHFDAGYSSLSIPVVNQNKANWLSTYERKLENAKVCSINDIKQTKRMAYNKVVNIYLADKKKTSLKQVAEAIGGELVTFNKTPEYCFYTLVTKVNSVSPLTKDIITEFSSAFAALESQCSNIDKRAIEEVQGIVLIKKMVTFIKDSFC